MFFGYVNGILKLGYQKPLDHEDLWDLADRDSATKLSSDFQAALASDKSNGKVISAVWQQYGASFVRAGLIKLVHDCTIFTGNIYHEYGFHFVSQYSYSLPFLSSMWI